MTRIEPTLEDWEDYWNSLDLDEINADEENERLLAERREAEREGARLALKASRARESGFGHSEDDDEGFPD